MHAVKAKYDHLPYQRTQIYGNLWYKKELKKIKSIISQPKWENFVIKKSGQKPQTTIATKIFDKTRSLFKTQKKIISASDAKILSRKEKN